MHLEEIGINAGNWVDSAQDRNLLESPCECGIEPPGSMSHGVSMYIHCMYSCLMKVEPTRRRQLETL